MNRNEKPKIMIIGPIPPPIHGSAIWTELYIGSDRLKDKFQVIHLDTSDRRSLDNIGKFDLVNIHLAFKNILSLIILSLTKRPNVVFLQISQGVPGYLRDGSFIFFSKIFNRAKIIIHLNGSYFRTFYNQTNYFMKRFIDLTMKFCDKVIVLGNCLKWIFDKWFDEQDIEVVPNGTVMNPQLGAKFNVLSKNRYVITYLSSLYKTKGIIDTIKSVKYVTSKREDVEYKIAGPWRNQEPETQIECMKFLKVNNIENAVDFLGVVTGDEKVDLLVNTDIFVFPTYYPLEGHPNVVIEAMSAGCPVISTNHAAIPETVIDGESGILVEKQNPQALANAIIKLIENPELRIKMGKAGRERYEKFYTQEENIDNMIRVFETALEP